jgi:RNA polymerase sigma-70 factor (ECF subfamily)
MATVKNVNQYLHRKKFVQTIGWQRLRAFMNLNAASPDDKELIAASRQGNQAAFRLLFEKYWNDLFKIALKRMDSAEDVKDILQEVFVSFWNNLDTIQVKDSLGGYLYTALRNKILNYYEKQSRLKALAAHAFKPVEYENQAWFNLQTRELRQLVAAQLSAMPLQMRNIYLLSREEQLTNSEIAALMGIAPQTVKNQLYRALRRIRDGLGSADYQLTLLVLLAGICSEK